MEEAPPHAAPSSGDRRHCGVALEAVVQRGIVRVVEGGCVPIHKRTSDNGVFVRQEGVSTCAAALPYVAGLLAVPAPPAHGRSGPRPPEVEGATPLFKPLVRHRGRGAGAPLCAHQLPSPLGGRSLHSDPCGKAVKAMRKLLAEEQIIGVLKQAGAGARTPDLCRQVGTTSACSVMPIGYLDEQST